MISREEILKLAELSRLKLSDEEVVSLQKDFDSILEYVGQISAVASQGDTGAQDTALPPSHKATDGHGEKSPFGSSINIMREDIPRGADDALVGKREAILAQAPKREGDYFVVRKIIDRDQ